jgi:hypothetical protein
MSVPRRWAVHLEPWMSLDRIGAFFALVVVAGAGGLRPQVSPPRSGAGA